MTRSAPKIRLLVRMSLAHQPATEGHLFVGATPSRRGSPATLHSLLNSEDEFLPFEGSDGLTRLVSRAHVQWVLADRGVDQELLFSPVSGLMREELVQVRLEDGTEPRGFLLMELPHEMSRASDFMNGRFEFFTLNTAQGVLLINKHRVVEMTVFETSPLPVLEETAQDAA